MRSDVKIDRTADLTIFAPKCNVNYDVIIDFMVELYSNNPTKNVIWDLRKVLSVNVTSDEIRAALLLSSCNMQKRNGGKTAIIVRSSLDRSLARMAEFFVKNQNMPIDVRSFDDYLEAMRWILA